MWGANFKTNRFPLSFNEHLIVNPLVIPLVILWTPFPSEKKNSLYWTTCLSPSVSANYLGSHLPSTPPSSHTGLPALPPICWAHYTSGPLHWLFPSLGTLFLISSQVTCLQVFAEMLPSWTMNFPTSKFFSPPLHPIIRIIFLYSCS